MTLKEAKQRKLIERFARENSFGNIKGDEYAYEHIKNLLSFQFFELGVAFEKLKKAFRKDFKKPIRIVRRFLYKFNKLISD